jgi:hypothetical protein
MRLMITISAMLEVSALSACNQNIATDNDPTTSFESNLNLATIASTPQSWDYRIAKVITNSSQQVVNQDLWNATIASVKNLQNAGKAVICYFSAGTWEYDNDSRGIINQALTDRNNNGTIDGSGNTNEAQAVSEAIQADEESYDFNGRTLNFSADQKTFKNLAGSTLPGWDEYVYRIANFTLSSTTPEHKLLKAIMIGHMNRAQTLGCDALEPDNIDAYANVSDGISAANQYAYNVWLANTAHAKGAKIYLKNDLAQIANAGEGVPPGSSSGLAYKFDGLINEECFKFNECELAAPFRDLSKPIFVREYSVRATCTNYRNAKYGTTSSTRNQIANQYHLNVSVSQYGNGGSPDANATAPKCTFGTW